ncbi:hypothetical protein [Brevibacillus agri]|uniref:hypothetical protein n=1 Tax=Brevibacillus agri TaxID=51101 RepID=UPI002867F4B4|nr:hypothetical protein [Brevibacillus agri]
MRKREIDAIVAKALEFEYIVAGNGQVYYKTAQGGCELFAPTESWKSMGVLVEEAKKKGIYLMFEHNEDGYHGQAWRDNWSPHVDPCNEAPLAVTLAFLQTQGVYISGMDLT